MKRYLYLLSPVMIVVSVSAALSQTLTADTPPPAPQAAWEIILKLGFPIVMTVVGPFVTSFIKTAPPWAKYVVASLASLLVGAGAGAIPDFPLTIESAATIGVTSGATGQALFMHMPKGEVPS